MTEPTTTDTTHEPTPDESFSWTSEPAPTDGHGGGHKGADAGAAEPTGAAAAGATATAILESLREAVDDLAERATPTMREFSARAAELAADAADRAAPFARRAGEVTSDASGKLASKSRSWAADLRASLAASDAAATHTGSPAAADAPDTGESATEAQATVADDAGTASTDDATPA